MQQALDSAADIDEDSKTKMINFFRYIYDKLMSSKLCMYIVDSPLQRYILFDFQTHCILFGSWSWVKESKQRNRM